MSRIPRPYTFFLFIAVLLWTACSSYGPNQKEDFQKIEDSLKSNLKADSVNVTDTPTRLTVFLTSPYEEDSASFENVSSIANYLVMQHYQPNVLDMDKEVVIEMEDAKGGNFHNSSKVKYIIKLNMYLDKAFADLNEVLGSGYEGTNHAVHSFLTDSCYKKMTKNDGLQEANMLGAKWTTTNTVAVLILTEGNFNQHLKLVYDKKMSIIEIECI